MPAGWARSLRWVREVLAGVDGILLVRPDLAWKQAVPVENCSWEVIHIGSIHAHAYNSAHYYYAHASLTL